MLITRNTVNSLTKECLSNARKTFNIIPLLIKAVIIIITMIIIMIVMMIINNNNIIMIVMTIIPK